MKLIVSYDIESWQDEALRIWVEVYLPQIIADRFSDEGQVLTVGEITFREVPGLETEYVLEVCLDGMPEHKPCLSAHQGIWREISFQSGYKAGQFIVNGPMGQGSTDDGGLPTSS